ncbi:DUF4468 domain-containing protein [Pedobacter sp. GR22-6]|uniref:DUF4468 domain-containing protein n=1 Tax=Pedobacter sp. GR22-6 TaxID=3127957 RepID=UPI00307E11B3
MKFLFGLSFLVFAVNLCFGQDQPLAYDERGKLIHYEVVEMEGITKAQLDARAEKFFKKSAKMLKLKSAAGDSLMQAAGKIVITKTALVLSHPSGEVQYNFYAEAKDAKYRFWLTDYEFIPYQRDRYGNFVPSTVIGVPLERKPGKLNAGEWEAYLKYATSQSRVIAGQFKDAMNAKQEQAPKTKSPETISTKEW